MTERRLKWAKRLAVITAVGMFIVLLMGANVTIEVRLSRRVIGEGIEDGESVWL
ncbi:MAG: hypothetical protein H0U38_04150, partial [Chloroflexia bacterium]|nr:hypothetical protein [Chloroflexia bacterium]